MSLDKNVFTITTEGGYTKLPVLNIFPFQQNSVSSRADGLDVKSLNFHPDDQVWYLRQACNFEGES